MGGDSMKVRFANDSDLSAIQNLNHELFLFEINEFGENSFNDNWPYEELGRAYFKLRFSKEEIVVIELNNKIVGYLSWYTYSDKSRKEPYPLVAELDTFVVSKDFRNSGFGKMLFDEFKGICKERGVEVLSVSTNVKNLKGIGFYEKVGFAKNQVNLKQEI